MKLQMENVVFVQTSARNVLMVMKWKMKNVKK